MIKTENKNSNISTLRQLKDLFEEVIEENKDKIGIQEIVCKYKKEDNNLENSTKKIQKKQNIFQNIWNKIKNNLLFK